MSAGMPGPGAPAQDIGDACYVYGIVPGNAPAPSDTGVGSPPRPVTLIRYGRVAALVSGVDRGRPLGTPDDLRAHARVVNTLAAEGRAVLPFRFGGVVRDADAVAGELLGPFEERFATALDGLGGYSQYTVRGDYRKERVLREILAGRPDIARLRVEAANLSPDDGHDERIRLGELVSQELMARREADGDVLLDQLTPLAVAVSPGNPSPEEAVDASFLVRHDDRPRFEAAADKLASAWTGWIELRLIGPIAPYDFVSGIVEQAEGVL
ncbi:GvpL/GvpF family gas vesicle protein [Kitasatospora sp. NPDC004240]